MREKDEHHMINSFKFNDFCVRKFARFKTIGAVKTLKLSERERERERERENAK
jgi:hypothetical protein